MPHAGLYELIDNERGILGPDLGLVLGDDQEDDGWAILDDRRIEIGMATRATERGVGVPDRKGFVQL